MRKNKEILRLKYEAGLSARQIAQSLSLAHSTVGDLLRRAEAAGLSWPLPEGMDDTALQRLLYPGNPQPARPRSEPDMVSVVNENRTSVLIEFRTTLVGAPLFLLPVSRRSPGGAANA